MIGANIFFAYGPLALFVAALLLAAVSDVKTRRIPNAAPLLLLSAGLLNFFREARFYITFFPRCSACFSAASPCLSLRFSGEPSAAGT